jgi:hypothetical protein
VVSKQLLKKNTCGSGTLEKPELKSLAEQLFCPNKSMPLTVEEIEKEMGKMGADVSGSVSFAAFSKWWSDLTWQVVKEEDPQAEIDEASANDHEHEVRPTARHTRVHQPTLPPYTITDTIRIGPFHPPQPTPPPGLFVPALRQVTVVLSGIAMPREDNSYVLYAFDVKVFGVTVLAAPSLVMEDRLCGISCGDRDQILFLRIRDSGRSTSSSIATAACAKFTTRCPPPNPPTTHGSGSIVGADALYKVSPCLPFFLPFRCVPRAVWMITASTTFRSKATSRTTRRTRPTRISGGKIC